MMEGISQEALSIAGHLRLGKLIAIYDDNHITIDGSTALSFDGEDHAARLRAAAGTSGTSTTPRMSTRSPGRSPRGAKSATARR